MEASPGGFRRYINRLTQLFNNAVVGRLSLIVAVSLAISSCRDASAPTEPAVLAVLSVELSLPPGRGAFVESDTVTIYARVMDRNGVAQPDAEVEWEGPVAPTGPQTALATLGVGDNVIVGRVRSRGQLAMAKSISVAARARSGEILLWFPDGSVSRVAAPPGVADISPAAINDRDEVTGWLRYPEGPRRAFVWSAASGFTELTNSFAERDMFAADINDEGIVVGTVLTQGEYLAFVWSREKGFVLIPDETPSRSVAMSVNKSGKVAGMRNNRPFSWSNDIGFMSYAGGGSPPPSYETFEMYSTGVAINDNDDILASWSGKYTQGIDYYWGFDGYPSIWTGTQNISLGCKACVVSAMNNRREVVGVDLWADWQAFRWTEATGVQILAGVPGQRSEAVAINEAGVVAGSVLSWDWTGDTSRAAVWHGGTVTLIGTHPGIRSTNARDINSHGHVLVYAR